MFDIAVFFERLGPYHLARLNALGRRAKVLAVEIFDNDSTYAWEKVTAEGEFKRVTLFEGNQLPLGISGMLRRVSQVLGQHRPKAVAINGWADKAALATLAWCLRASTPTVLMSDSQAVDEPRAWWKEGIKRRVVQCFDAALVAGQPHAEYVQSLGMPPERVFAGYDVVDNDYFFNQAQATREQAAARRRQLNLPARYFLACNRFVEKKNLNRLLLAYAGYKQAVGTRAWHLVLLGDGPLKPELDKLVQSLRLTQEVHMPGFKQYRELPAYYALASAFVHASTSEQWGLVVNEAMASGLPVLVSQRCGCATNLVLDGHNGFCFDPFRVEDIAARLEEISNPALDLADMGRASLDLIRYWSPAAFAGAMQRAAASAIAAAGGKSRAYNPFLFWVLTHR